MVNVLFGLGTWKASGLSCKRGHDGSDWPTQPNETCPLTQQVTRIDEGWSFFSTRFAETQLFKSNKVFDEDALNI